MHPSYSLCTTHTEHKQRTPTHLLAAATCSCCKHHDHQTENTKTKIKKRDKDLELWYTHYLAHHLTGARNTDYLAYPVVSQESLTCNNSPVAVEIESIHFCCHVSIFTIFDTNPKRVVTTNKYLLTFCINTILTSCTVDIHQLKKKCPNFQIIYVEEFIKCDAGRTTKFTLVKSLRFSELFSEFFFPNSVLLCSLEWNHEAPHFIFFKPRKEEPPKSSHLSG